MLTAPSTHPWRYFTTSLLNVATCSFPTTLAIFLFQVGCTVTAQQPQRPETQRQICNAYFTFLSNGEDKKPLRLAPVIPETYGEQ